VNEIHLRLTALELDFIGTVLSNVSFGSVANANMTHLLGKLREQANGKHLLDGAQEQTQVASPN
jgi:hypothetical protein